MAVRPVSEWDVLNRFLAGAIGSARDGSWSLGQARRASFDGVWDDLVSVSLAVSTRVVTDSNMHTSCVYEVGDGGEILLISTVLPFFAVWSGSEQQYLNDAPAWAEPLFESHFSLLGGSAARTLSPYRDNDADRRITYAELLFEWTEGSDGPAAETVVDPWVVDAS